MNILVVGASSGIGMAVAKHLSFAGHDIIGIGRRVLMQWLAGPRYLTCDATSVPRLQVALFAIEAQWTRIDTIILCAARHGPILPALSPDAGYFGYDWLDAFSDNMAMTLLPLQVFSGLLRKSERPVAICFSGGGAGNARPNFSAYSCAKTAVVRLVENIAAEEPWLHINAVAPGVFRTELTEEILHTPEPAVGPEERAAVMRAMPPDSNSSEKLMQLIDWLLSPESNGVTGRLISARYDIVTRLHLDNNHGKLRRVEL